MLPFVIYSVSAAVGWVLKGLGGSRERSSLGHLWAATDGTGGQQMHLQHVLQTFGEMLSLCRSFSLINLTLLKKTVLIFCIMKLHIENQYEAEGAEVKKN